MLFGFVKFLIELEAIVKLSEVVGLAVCRSVSEHKVGCFPSQMFANGKMFQYVLVFLSAMFSSFIDVIDGFSKTFKRITQQTFGCHVKTI